MLGNWCVYCPLISKIPTNSFFAYALYQWRSQYLCVWDDFISNITKRFKLSPDKSIEVEISVALNYSQASFTVFHLLITSPKRKVLANIGNNDITHALFANCARLPKDVLILIIDHLH